MGRSRTVATFTCSNGTIYHHAIPFVDVYDLDDLINQRLSLRIQGSNQSGTLLAYTEVDGAN